MGCLLGVFCLGSFEFRCYPLLESFVCVFLRCRSMHMCIEKGNMELWGGTCLVDDGTRESMCFCVSVCVWMDGLVGGEKKRD